MFRVIWLMTRKPEISPAEFRAHYERSHLKLAQKYFGHLFLEHRRNYPLDVKGGGTPTVGGGGLSNQNFRYDCIAEWVLPNEEAYHEIFRIINDPVIGKEFLDDEEIFLDRSGLVVITCDSASGFVSTPKPGVFEY